MPLCFWFIYNCISFRNYDYDEIIVFFNSYINSFLFLIFMISMLIHSKIGLETIIEDYISSNSFKLLILWLINSISYGAVLISLVSIFILSTNL